MSKNVNSKENNSKLAIIKQSTKKPAEFCGDFYEKVPKIKAKPKTNIFDIDGKCISNILNYTGINDVLNLLAANNNLFAMVSPLTDFYYKLNKHYSLKYFHDKKFRERVIKRVGDIKNKLSLNLSECSSITDVSALGGVHTLDLYMCSNITDVSALGGVHTLDLSECGMITDVSALGGVHTLDLSSCGKITGVSALGGVHTLNLSCCLITDVSALGEVTNLSLSGCKNITDVSGCKNITDVSALGREKQHTLGRGPGPGRGRGRGTWQHR